ncbi:MAG: hypothetical protein M1476_01305 [Candidatus Thermoplasmatota archaeon]|nr:hypothetical protein [Candidatus Thermoplasmatota archaeon]
MAKKGKQKGKEKADGEVVVFIGQPSAIKKIFGKSGKRKEGKSKAPKKKGRSVRLVQR